MVFRVSPNEGPILVPLKIRRRNIVYNQKEPIILRAAQGEPGWPSLTQASRKPHSGKGLGFTNNVPTLLDCF